jgi:hypothetical protein
LSGKKKSKKKPEIIQETLGELVESKQQKKGVSKKKLEETIFSEKEN